MKCRNVRSKRKLTEEQNERKVKQTDGKNGTKLCSQIDDITEIYHFTWEKNNFFVEFFSFRFIYIFIEISIELYVCMHVFCAVFAGTPRSSHTLTDLSRFLRFYWLNITSTVYSLHTLTLIAVNKCEMLESM